MKFNHSASPPFSDEKIEVGEVSGLLKITWLLVHDSLTRTHHAFVTLTLTAPGKVGGYLTNLREANEFFLAFRVVSILKDLETYGINFKRWP